MLFYVRQTINMYSYNTKTILLQNSKTDSQKNVEDVELMTNFLRTAYGVLANDDARSLVSCILEHGEIRSLDLMIETGIPKSNFYNILKKLQDLNIISRRVADDRSTHYDLTFYAKNILEVSEDLFTKISKNRVRYDISSHPNNLTKNINTNLKKRKKKLEQIQANDNSLSYEDEREIFSDNTENVD